MTPPRWYFATACAPVLTSAPNIAWLAAASAALGAVALSP
jgi:hypothetical protein